MTEEPKKRGKPRKSEGEKKAARALNVRISQEDFNRLSEFCKSKDKRVVDVVRIALREYIDAQNKTQKLVKKIADRIAEKRKSDGENASDRLNEGGNNEDA